MRHPELISILSCDSCGRFFTSGIDELNHTIDHGSHIVCQGKSSSRQYQLKTKDDEKMYIRKKISEFCATASAETIREIAEKLLPENKDAPALLRLFGSLNILLLDDAGTELTSSQARNDMESIAKKRESGEQPAKADPLVDFLGRLTEALGIKPLGEPYVAPEPGKANEQTEFPIPVWVFNKHTALVENHGAASRLRQAVEDLVNFHNEESGFDNDEDAVLVGRSIQRMLEGATAIENTYKHTIESIEEECLRQAEAAAKRDEGTPWVTIEQQDSEAAIEGYEIRSSNGEHVAYVDDLPAAYSYALDNHLVVVDPNAASVLRGRGEELI